MKKLYILFTLFLAISANSIGSVTFILPEKTGANGTQITVPVKVKDFLNIISAQGTIQFDPAIVTYSSVQQFGLPGMNASSFGTTGSSTGKLTFSWYDGSLVGVSVADSTTIFSITFNIIGTNSQISPLNFVNSPTLIEVVDNSFNTLTTILDNGSITVQNGLSPTITLYLDSATNSVGSQISISLKAIDFTNINSIQGTIQFDPAVATYISVSYYGLPGMNSSNFGTTQVSSGKLTFTWYDSSLEGINKTDNTPLFTVLFTLSCTPTNSSSLNIIDNPTLIEVTDSLFNTLTTNVVSGKITSQPIVVVAQASPPVICTGDQVVLNATGALSYTWMPGNIAGSPVIVYPTATTQFDLIGNSYGCISTTTVLVTVDEPAVAEFTPIDNGNGSFTFNNTSQNAMSYSWDFGDGSYDNSPNPNHTYTASGNYYVVLTAINSCGPVLHTILLNVVISDIQQKSLLSLLEVFPNPSNGNVNIKYDTANDFYLTLYNVIGEIIFKKKYSVNSLISTIPLDFSGLSNGIYQLEIDDGKELSRTSLIISK